MSKEQIDEAVRLYESGLSLIRVDKVVGADPKTVKALLMEAEVPMRGVHRKIGCKDESDP